MNNIIFISAYSEENVYLGGEFCETTASVCAYWRNKLLDQSKLDFMSLMVGSQSRAYEEAMIIPSTPQEETFTSDIISIIMASGFTPDFIVVRGETTDIWPVIAIKENLGIDVPLIAILDRLTPPVEEFEFAVLNSFDFIVQMGTSCDIPQIEDKAIKIFNDFESYFFRDASPYVSTPIRQEGSVLIATNEDKYQEYKDKYSLKSEKISIFDVSKCPQDELALYLNVADIVVDETDNEEFGLILKKMGLENISLEELALNNYNLKGDELAKIQARIINLKDFSSFLKNKIMNSVNGRLISPDRVTGADIRV